MKGRWTFNRKLWVGLTAKALITLIVCGVAVYALRYVIVAKDRVITYNTRILTDAHRLESFVLERMGNVRAFVLTGDQSAKETVRLMREKYFVLVRDLRNRVDTPQEKQLLDQLAKDATTQFDSGDRVVEMRESQKDLVSIGKAFQQRVVPLSGILRTHLAEFIKLEEGHLENAKAEASGTASRAILLVIGFGTIGVAIALVLALFLSRSLNRQIGSAVQHIQNSASELQAAANQQTTTAKEQVASMTEISTTIKELLSTAKQIAESAQAVARIATNTSASAENGDETVRKAQTEVGAIRQQVNVIVDHMLDLGRKSQQIGGILDIINELAEQTNILAINATIEAAGAGEAGRRFSVVAEEIRKLADRVGGSTKEIRGLIDQIRPAVNATVLATESGSKAVDAGTRQFGEVTQVFGQISDLLRNTTEAAREIELSTKQQSSAVEQVNTAVANVAQAAREAEASSSQVLQTVAELTTLSRDLGRFINSDGRA